jgi:predicted dehydrogenase
MKKKIRVALIGAGRIAGHHIKSIKKNKDFKIVAISDLIKKKALFYSEKYGFKAFGHYHEMLKSEKNIDLVAIMTPSGMHYKHAKDILNKFSTNLLIEKPTFLKSSQVKTIYKLAQKKKVKIFPVFQNRYNRAVQRVKQAIIKNELGKINIVSIRVRWCREQRYYNLADWRGTFSHDGGALTNQGIHHIDLLRFLIGEVKSVNCLMKTLGSKIEVEDSVVSNLDFMKKKIGTLEITTAARPKDYEASISIIGSKGLAQIGGLAVNELQIFTPNSQDCKKFSQKIPDAYGFGHFYVYRDIAKDLLKKKNYPINFKDCFKTIQLLNSFYISNEKNKTIYIKKVLDSKKLGRKNDKITKKYS